MTSLPPLVPRPIQQRPSCAALARVVLIEPNPVLHRPLLRALHHAGCQIDLITTRLADVTATTSHTDLVILDLDGHDSRDDANGLQLCQHLRACADTLPILILATRSTPIDRAVGLDYGGSDYLPKPFRLATLQARVRALLGRAGSDDAVGPC